MEAFSKEKQTCVPGAELPFETDAENMYFSRKTKPGNYRLYLTTNQGETVEVNHYLIENGVKLYNGIATLNITIDEKFKIGEIYQFLLEVNDPMRIIDPPFQNKFSLIISQTIRYSIGNPNARRNPPSNDPGNDREKPSGIRIPETIRIYEKDWETQGFNKFTALKAIKAKEEKESPNTLSLLIWTIFIYSMK